MSGGLPGDVEDAMADIAAVFHWPPSAMDPMSPGELARWWSKARARAGGESDGR